MLDDYSVKRDKSIVIE